MKILFSHEGDGILLPMDATLLGQLATYPVVKTSGYGDNQRVLLMEKPGINFQVVTDAEIGEASGELAEARAEAQRWCDRWAEKDNLAKAYKKQLEDAGITPATL